MEIKDTKPWIKINHILPDGQILKHEGELEMDQFRQFIGDGNMKVTYSMSQSDKAFGNGCETFISITATCNQDQVTPIKTVMLIKELIASILPGLHSEALAVWKQNNELNKDIMGVR